MGFNEYRTHLSESQIALEAMLLKKTSLVHECPSSYCINIILTKQTEVCDNLKR